MPQLPLQTVYCYMKYAYNWDRIICHNILSITLNIFLIYLLQSVVQNESSVGTLFAVQETMMYVTNLLGLENRTCWPLDYKMRQDLVGHPGVFAYCI